MVSSVADAPAMKGNKNRCVSQMANEIIEPFVLGKRTVTAVVSYDKQRPEHGTLHQPEHRPEPPGIKKSGHPIEEADD
jgi:hypothetical protein